MQHKKNIAMTLAEVLIMLGIIGIVAALTISTLFNNYHKREYASKLKISALNLAKYWKSIRRRLADELLDNTLFESVRAVFA